MFNKKRNFYILTALAYVMLMLSISCANPDLETQIPLSEKKASNKTELVDTNDANTNSIVGRDEGLESLLAKKTTIVTVSTNKYHSLAITNTGQLYAWGKNQMGELGIGNNQVQPIPQKVQVDGVTSWKSGATGFLHSLAITNTGELYAWGFNIHGQLGLGNNTNQNTPQKVQVDGVTGWKNVVAGNFHTAAITNTGELYTWGTNGIGQLGIGNYISKNTPQKVYVNGVDKWKRVTARKNNTFAITETGKLYAWGENSRYKQLGLGNTDDKNIPTLVTAKEVDSWKDVSVGDRNNVVAITADGRLFRWGKLQLSGSFIFYDSPKQFGSDTDWQSVSVGSIHNLAIKENGSLYAWGLNNYGQLGHGDKDGKRMPQKVYLYDVLDGWKNVVAGDYYTFAITNTGELYAWGKNNLGITLGLVFSTTDKLTPTLVPIDAFENK